MDNPDLQFAHLGSFAMCSPMSERGKEWIFDNIQAGMPGVDEAIGDCLWPVYIDFRYLADIVNGARAAGLICHG